MARILIALILISLPRVFARDLSSNYEKAEFKLGEQKFHAYIADTDDRRAKGLMFIRELPEDTGMLFVFEEEHHLSFWMKNTLIPLSIGFINAKGELVDIQEMKVATGVTLPSYVSRKPALFALEMNKGWFSRRKIKLGAELKLISKTGSKLLMKSLKPAKDARQ